MKDLEFGRSAASPSLTSPTLAGEVCDAFERGVSAVDAACLKAASKGGLVRMQAEPGNGLLCPGSRHAEFGWWGRQANAGTDFSRRRIDSSRGGPWSVERVHHLCGLGLLGINHYHERVASITTEGRRALTRLKASQSLFDTREASKPKARATEPKDPEHRP